MAFQTFYLSQNLTKLRSFLGACSVSRRFVTNFSKIAQPLTDLTRKDGSQDFANPATAQRKSSSVVEQRLASSQFLSFRNKADRTRWISTHPRINLNARFYKNKRMKRCTPSATVHTLLTTSNAVTLLMNGNDMRWPGQLGPYVRLSEECGLRFARIKTRFGSC